MGQSTYWHRTRKRLCQCRRYWQGVVLGIPDPHGWWQSLGEKGGKVLLTEEEDEVMDYLDKLDVYKLMGSDGKQPSTLGAGQCHCEATFCHV